MMQKRKPRDRQFNQEELEEWHRWYLENHPEAAEAEAQRKLAIIEREWQD